VWLKEGKSPRKREFWRDFIFKQKGRNENMSGNKGVVYKGAGNVAVEDIGYPDLVLRDGT